MDQTVLRIEESSSIYHMHKGNKSRCLEDGEGSFDSCEEINVLFGNYRGGRGENCHSLANFAL